LSLSVAKPSVAHIFICRYQEALSCSHKGHKQIT
jgi:hypothetical protein